MILTPGLFLVLACGSRTRIRPTVSITCATLVFLRQFENQGLLAFTISDPLSVPSLRMEDGSMVTFLSHYVLSVLLSSSTSESDGLPGSPQRVCRCGILCSPVFSLCSSPCISPPVSLTRYGMVGTVAGDGAPRSLSDFRSSGVCGTRPFSFSDSSLGGLRPFWLLLFHPALPFFVSLALRFWLTLLLHSPLSHINYFHLGTTGIIRHEWVCWLTVSYTCQKIATSPLPPLTILQRQWTGC